MPLALAGHLCAQASGKQLERPLDDSAVKAALDKLYHG